MAKNQTIQLPFNCRVPGSLYLAVHPHFVNKCKLVGGFNPLEKYEFANGKDYTIYHGNLWNIKNVCNHQPDVYP